MHLSTTLLVLLASTTHAFAPAVKRARAPSPRAQWWDEDSTPSAAPTTATATGEHPIKSGDHLRIHYTLTTTSGLPLDGAELTFDTEEVDQRVLDSFWHLRVK